MNKKGIILLLALVLCLAFVTVSFSEEEAGRVLAVKKRVYVIRNDNRDDAIPKMPLLMKDAVETDAKSRTKLFFTDDSILSLGEKSRVEVEEYLYSSEENKSKSIYKLMDGYLKVVVGRSDLEIHTPTAVAAARGTKFIVVTGGHGESAFTDVIVLSGKVDTWSAIKGISAGKVTVGAGNSTRIQMNKPPENAKATQGEVTAQFAENTTVVGEFNDSGGELPTLVVEPKTEPGPSFPPERPDIIETINKVNNDIVPKEAFTPVTININFPD